MEAVIKAVRVQKGEKSFIVVTIDGNEIYNYAHKSEANCVSGIAEYNSISGWSINRLSKSASRTASYAEFLNDEATTRPGTYGCLDKVTGEWVIPSVSFYYFDIEEAN